MKRGAMPVIAVVTLDLAHLPRTGDPPPADLPSVDVDAIDEEPARAERYAEWAGATALPRDRSGRSVIILVAVVAVTGLGLRLGHAFVAHEDVGVDADP